VDLSKKKAQKKIMAGERPILNATIANSTDKATQTLIKAMNKCWIHNPEKRASARSIEEYLDKALIQLGVYSKPAE